MANVVSLVPSPAFFKVAINFSVSTPDIFSCIIVSTSKIGLALPAASWAVLPNISSHWAREPISDCNCMMPRAAMLPPFWPR
jgi:hypothetical protein